MHRLKSQSLTSEASVSFFSTRFLAMVGNTRASETKSTSRSSESAPKGMLRDLPIEIVELVAGSWFSTSVQKCGASEEQPAGRWCCLDEGEGRAPWAYIVHITTSISRHARPPTTFGPQRQLISFGDAAPPHHRHGTIHSNLHIDFGDMRVACQPRWQEVNFLSGCAPNRI